MKEDKGGEDKMAIAADDSDKPDGNTLRTAAQKRADKKEREKEKKRKEAAKAKEKLAAQQQGATAAEVSDTLEKTVEETDVTEKKLPKDVAGKSMRVCALLTTVCPIQWTQQKTLQLL